MRPHARRGCREELGAEPVDERRTTGGGEGRPGPARVWASKNVAASGWDIG
ncbi:hypothetical protein [Dactylosporangium cerinum]